MSAAAAQQGPLHVAPGPIAHPVSPAIAHLCAAAAAAAEHVRWDRDAKRQLESALRGGSYPRGRGIARELRRRAAAEWD